MLPGSIFSFTGAGKLSNTERRSLSRACRGQEQEALCNLGLVVLRAVLLCGVIVHNKELFFPPLKDFRPEVCLEIKKWY